jgi:hypothetical protein
MTMDNRSIASRKKEEKEDGRPFWETESFFEGSIDLESLCEPIEELRGPLQWKKSPKRPRKLKQLQATRVVDDDDDEDDNDQSDDFTAYFSFGQTGAVAEKSQRKNSTILLGVLLLMSMISFGVTELILNSLMLNTEQTDNSNLPSLEGEQSAIRNNDIRKVLSQVSGDEAFSIESSPQAEALLWITHKDLLQLNAKSRNLIQRYVLAVLYYSTTPDGWNNRCNWLSAKHECEWSDGGGIRACTKDKEVMDISLWNNLQGTLPTEIGYLTKLQVLYLARNKLKGNIPTEIGKLTALTYLGLQHNSFRGTFPSVFFGNLTKLKTLYLERNDFTGSIPRSDPLCQLRKNAIPGLGGALQHFTGDCKTLVEWKKPELACSCCTKCYPA